MAKARVIALYLPQYHPIPENDEWWGKGFTEWTNVAKAKPLFRYHYQPHIPADLGFYDLRMPEIREAQAELAREAGIEGFCYWHYWFDRDHKLLERPFNEVLESGSPDFPFCIGWANHSWTNKTWIKSAARAKESTLCEQRYDPEDYEIHFMELLKAFKDPRYITVDGKPLFLVFDPFAIPDDLIPSWQKMARENGLEGIHFVGIASNIKTFDKDADGKKHYIRISPSDPAMANLQPVFDKGFDAVNTRGVMRAELIAGGKLKKYFTKALEVYLKLDVLKVFRYKDIIKHLFVPEDRLENVYPTILSNWDRSPRSGRKAVVYHESTPELFREHVRDAVSLVSDKKDEHKIIFLQSWNEWAEGNHVEPDLRYGKGYLEALKNEL